MVQRLPHFPLLVGPFVLSVLLGAAAPQERGLLQTSTFGGISGPLERSPDQTETEADLGDLQRTFSLGQEALSHRDYPEAARLFEEVFTRGGWPEAAYNAAVAHYVGGGYGRAEELAAIAAAALPQQKACLLLHGVLLNALGRHQDAVAVLEQADAGSDPTNETVESALLRINLASSLTLLGQTERAEDLAAEGLALGKKLRSRTVQSAALEAMGHIADLLGKPMLAERRWAEARAAGGSQVEGSDLELTLARAEAAWARGQQEKTQRTLDELQQHLGRVSDPLRRASVGLAASGLARSTGAHDQAQQLLQEAETLFKAAGLTVGLADGKVLRARWALEDGRLDHSERLAQEAEELQSVLQVPLARASTLLLRAEIHARRGQWDAGLAGLRDAAEAISALGPSPLRIQLHLVRSDLALRQGDATLALEEARRAESAATTLKNESAVVEARVEQAIALAVSDQWEDLHTLAGDFPQGPWKALRPRVRARLSLEWARSAHRLGHVEDAQRRASTALSELARLPEGPDRTDLEEAALSVQIACLALSGRVEEAKTLLKARNISQGPLVDQLQAAVQQALYNSGVQSFEEGSYAAAIEVWTALLTEPALEPERLEATQRNLQAAFLRRGRDRMEREQFEDAQSDFQQALALSRTRGDSLGAAWVLLELSQVRAQVEDPSGAGQLAQEAALAAEAASEPAVAAQAWMLAGQSLFDSEPELSRDAFLQAWAQLPAHEAHLGKRAIVSYNLAVLFDAHGDRDEARRWCERSKALAAKATVPGLSERLQLLSDRWRSSDGE